MYGIKQKSFIQDTTTIMCRDLGLYEDISSKEKKGFAELENQKCFVCNSIRPIKTQSNLELYLGFHLYHKVSSEERKKICLLLSEIIGEKRVDEFKDGILCNDCFGQIDFIDSLQRKISHEKDKIRKLFQTTDICNKNVEDIVTCESQTRNKKNDHDMDSTKMLINQKSQYKCPNCEELFKFTILLRSHLIKKHCIPLATVDELVLKCALFRTALRSNRDIRSNECSIAIDLSCIWCDTEYAASAWSEYYEHISCHLQKSHDEYCKLVTNYRIGDICCKLCSSIFKTVKKMENHSKNSHDKNVEYSCLLCRESCQGYGAMLRHVNHHILGYQQCTLCPTKHSSQFQSFSHLEYFHNDNYVVKCTHCEKSFKNSEQYYNHICQHAVKEDKDLGSSKTIQFQLNSSKTSCQYKCEECGNCFKIYGALIAHQVGHFFGIYHCPHCRLKFSKIDQISKHLCKAHPSINGLECKICLNVYKTYETYLHHLRIEHPKMSGGVSTVQNCNVCVKEFANKAQLYRHNKLHHSYKKLYSCDICGANVQNLKLHMNNHTRSNVFSCKDCGIQYFNYSSLQLHRKRRHMGNSAKKLQCNICDKLFISPVDLKVHISRVHKGERNYTCEYCTKNYKSKSSLTYHRRIHTGEKPHACVICNIGFENPSLLKKHIEKDHNATYVGIYKKNPILKKEKAESIHIDIPNDMKMETITLAAIQNPSRLKEVVYIIN